jgi:hypothetical protein
LDQRTFAMMHAGTSVAHTGASGCLPVHDDISMHCGAQDFHIEDDGNKDSTAPLRLYAGTVLTSRSDGCMSFVLIWIVTVMARLETNGYADAMCNSIIFPSSKVGGNHVRECRGVARAFRAKCMSHATILLTLRCE